MPRPRTRNQRHERQFAMRAPRVERRIQAIDTPAPLAREDWQADAYGYAHAVGEVNYALNLKANTLARCRLRPECRQPGTDEWEETTDARVLRVHNALRPPLGGQSELLRKALLHLDIAGETILYGDPITDLAGNPAGLTWEFLSVLEVDIKKDGQVTRNPWGASKGKGVTPDEAYVARLHRSAPDFSQRAASPMQGVLAILRQIVLLTQVIDAIARSRLTSGILYAPWEVSFGPDDEFENPGADPRSAQAVDEFEAELREHLMAPITDPSSEASLMPLLMRGPSHLEGTPTKDLIGLIDLARDLDDRFQGLRKEALDRLAAGLDLPPELMQGKGSLSGLGGGNVAASVDAEFVDKHIIPNGDMIAGFLTVSYLRPMLVNFEGMTPADADWFRYSLDASALTADPDRSQQATTGYDRYLLSDDVWIAANGFTPDDMPDDEEVYQRRLIDLAAKAPVTLGPVLLPLAFPDRPEIADAMAKVLAASADPATAGGVPPATAALLRELAVNGNGGGHG